MSIPRITAVEIVAPDLEIPGIIAIACAIPTRREDERLIFFSLGLALSAKKSKAPVRISIAPTIVKFPLNKDSISDSKKNPTKTAEPSKRIILTENQSYHSFQN